MLAGDARPLPPPDDALAVTAMSLSTLSRAVVRVQKEHGIRKERIGEESTWMLSRFYPILESGTSQHKNLHWKETQRIRSTLQKQLQGDREDNSSLARWSTTKKA